MHQPDAAHGELGVDAPRADGVDDVLIGAQQVRVYPKGHLGGQLVADFHGAYQIVLSPLRIEGAELVEIHAGAGVVVVEQHVELGLSKRFIKRFIGNLEVLIEIEHDVGGDDVALHLFQVEQQFASLFEEFRVRGEVAELSFGQDRVQDLGELLQVVLEITCLEERVLEFVESHLERFAVVDGGIVCFESFLEGLVELIEADLLPGKAAGDLVPESLLFALLGVERLCQTDGFCHDLGKGNLFLYIRIPRLLGASDCGIEQFRGRVQGHLVQIGHIIRDISCADASHLRLRHHSSDYGKRNRHGPERGLRPGPATPFVLEHLLPLVLWGLDPARVAAAVFVGNGALERRVGHLSEEDSLAGRYGELDSGFRQLVLPAINRDAAAVSREVLVEQGGCFEDEASSFGQGHEQVSQVDRQPRGIELEEEIVHAQIFLIDVQDAVSFEHEIGPFLHHQRGDPPSASFFQNLDRVLCGDHLPGVEEDLLQAVRDGSTVEILFQPRCFRVEQVYPLGVEKGQLSRSIREFDGEERIVESRVGDIEFIGPGQRDRICRNLCQCEPCCRDILRPAGSRSDRNGYPQRKDRQHTCPALFSFILVVSHCFFLPLFEMSTRLIVRSGGVPFDPI